jgi:hypothetical protein
VSRPWHWIPLAALAAAGGCGASPELGACTTTKVVVARTVPALERAFDLAEFTRDCDPVENGTDGARLTLTSARDYSSRARLDAAVRAALARAGWSERGGRLGRREGDRRYTATVRVQARAPALAFVEIASAVPGAADVSVKKVRGAVAERALPEPERLRYVTFSAFAPRFVPPGYARWKAPVVSDARTYAQTTAELVPRKALVRTGSAPPSLDAAAVPAGWRPQRCDAADTEPRGCVALGTTRSGIAVYVARDDHYADGLGEHPQAVVRGTLVTLHAGHNVRAEWPAIGRADVLRIFDSLRAHNAPAKP